MRGVTIWILVLTMESPNTLVNVLGLVPFLGAGIFCFKGCDLLFQYRSGSVGHGVKIFALLLIAATGVGMVVIAYWARLGLARVAGWNGSPESAAQCRCKKGGRMTTKRVPIYLAVSLFVLFPLLRVHISNTPIIAQNLGYEESLYFPIVADLFHNVGEGDTFYLGQRSSSRCAEHDSYVVPVAIATDGDTLSTGADITSQYRIRATHPLTEAHPLGEPWYQWCDADWTDCPSGQQDKASFAESATLLQFADTITKVYDACRSQEQIYVLDGAEDIGTFEVIVNGVSYGNHCGVILGSRWDAEDSWNHDGVIYANGFTRWKPKGEQPGAETDPCFGTSVVLGPFHIVEPFLGDGYSPNPLRHPRIETINITVCPGWEVHMTGALFAAQQRLMDVSWSLERLNINSSEMFVSVFQQAVAIQDMSLYEVLGQYGIGQVGMSSMYASPEKHDADTQIGSGREIWAGYISDSNKGLWGQEVALHRLAEGGSLCLETKTPTTHNTGSPALCILWGSGDVQ